MSKSTTTSMPGPALQGSGPGGPAARPVAAPRIVRQRRRRPGLIALSVALISVGGLSGAVLYSTSGQRTAVVVVTRDLPVGATITKGDLGQASMALDPAVKSVQASKADSLVGQRAAVDLRAGSLLSPDQVTDKSLVAPGEQLVGVSVKPSQLPATPLAAGRKVLVVSTPDPDAGTGADKPADVSAPKTLEVTVVAVGEPAAGTGNVVVDVAVPAGDGPALAARAATGDVALIVAARDGS
ncbi:SAF domain-containing protein [Streptomyces sp. NPDC002917]|uniref:SAF domain-containing protein n=1 Tax=Streptomyces sp. NPDC002917 TaxID=3364671 RepID=UPI0036A9D551